MIAYTKICVHCHSPYTYHASGSGIGRYNNDRYCPSCYEKILAVLETIPETYKEQSWAIDFPDVEQTKRIIEQIKVTEKLEDAKRGPYSLKMYPVLWQVHFSAVVEDASAIFPEYPYLKDHSIYVVRDYAGQEFIFLQHVWKEVATGKFYFRIDAGEKAGIWKSNHYTAIPEALSNYFKPIYELMAKEPPQIYEEYPMDMPRNRLFYLKHTYSSDTLKEMEDMMKCDTESLLIDAVTKEMKGHAEFNARYEQGPPTETYVQDHKDSE